MTDVSRARAASNSTVRSRARRKPANPFAVGSVVVHPARGVFAVAATQTLRVDEQDVPALILAAEGEGGSLAVPLARAAVTLRPLTTPAAMQEAFDVLRRPPRRSRAPWARRAQDYAARIKSGDPMRIAEILRDVHRGPQDGEQSWSERQVFERALDRFVAEFAAVERIGRAEALQRVMSALDERAVIRR
ncbi:CarD family transcriptional regulator [Roseomonas rosulenta]|uniref:CarD family transcriptional regulator n=1 Tax=Roseomonas rosulenta TaxID=2748667 RepID=UPI0018DEF8CE|nr:CarD family transcriptional regulator [Roseomonas rosulenta]